MPQKISDISVGKGDLEKSEIFNKIVLESSPDCLKILDTQGRLQFMNFNGLCQMEIDDFSLFKNQLWWDFWGKENINLVKGAVETALNGQVTDFIAFCPTAKGTPKWWHITVTPVGSAVDGIYQLLSVSRDITAQKNAEEEISKLNNLLEEKVKIRTEELLERNIELESANAELATYNHIASHDLQEPLRKIQIFSKLILESENVIDETHHNFNRIIDATERMRNLIDALHKFSASKNSKIIFEDCNLNSIVSDAIDHSQQIIDEKHATIEIKDLPILKGSPVLITQLFINILENALTYSKENIPPKIKFSHEIVDSSQLDIPIKNESKEFHVIKIEDNGIGFQNEYKKQIFEAFKRLHSKDKYAGTGIGLAICKTIIIKHNGWIDAVSALNVGSIFILYFQKD